MAISRTYAAYRTLPARMIRAPKLPGVLDVEAGYLARVARQPVKSTNDIQGQWGRAALIALIGITLPRPANMRSARRRYPNVRRETYP